MPFHVRWDCPTDPAHGCPPRERALAEYVRWGVVVLDKPPDCTSRRAADRVRRTLGAARVGHGGTLEVVTALARLNEKNTSLGEARLQLDLA